MEALERYRHARAAYHDALHQLTEIAKADPLLESVLNDMVTAEDVPWPEIYYGMRRIADHFKARHGREMLFADIKAARDAVHGAEH